MQITDIDVK